MILVGAFDSQGPDRGVTKPSQVHLAPLWHTSDGLSTPRWKSRGPRGWQKQQLLPTAQSRSEWPLVRVLGPFLPHLAAQGHQACLFRGGGGGGLGSRCLLLMPRKQTGPPSTQLEEGVCLAGRTGLCGWSGEAHCRKHVRIRLWSPGLEAEK